MGSDKNPEGAYRHTERTQVLWKGPVMAKVLRVAQRLGILRSVCVVSILGAACLGLVAWGATFLARDHGPRGETQLAGIAIPPDRPSPRESAVFRQAMKRS